MTAQDYIENSNMEFYNMTFHEKGLVEISYDDLGDLMESYAKCYLHNVVGRSEQCTHENEVQRQGNGFIYTVCGDCGEDLD